MALLALVCAVHTSARAESFQAGLDDEQRALLEAAIAERAGANSNTEQRSDARTVPEAAGQTAPPVTQAPEPEKLVLRAGSTVLLSVEKQPKKRSNDGAAGASGVGEVDEALEAMSPKAAEAISVLIDRIARGNPHRLDGQGALTIADLPRIQLAGLTEAQAAARLNFEPLLLGLRIGVAILPLIPDEQEALTPFGYAMFEGRSSSFAPPANTPVPTEYVLGPGDSLRMSLVGSVNRKLTLELDRNGEVSVPDLGVVALAGMRFEEAKAALEAQVAEQMIGVRAHVTMGSVRTMRVFVLGEAQQPGSYVVSGLSTLTNALVSSGGISRVGSLRRIQLKREGEVVATLDLYDLLLRGDTQSDVRLLPGDVIFIPPIGPTVGITGAVRRPAIYEMSTNESAARDVSTLVRLAGGFRPDADPAMAVVERISSERNRIVLNVDLSGDAAFRLHTGDLVRVPAIRPTMTAGISIDGHVHRPGAVGFVRGMRLTDAIGSIEDLKPDADLHYVLIRREATSDRHVDVISVDLAEAWARPNSSANLKLAARDRIIVFDTGGTRTSAIASLLNEMRRQSTSAAPTRIVFIRGSVKAPGEYPLELGMRVSDLLRAGGGLADSAYTGRAELTRYANDDGERREVELLGVDLNAVRAGDTNADVELRPFDIVLIKAVPQWSEAQSIRLLGEFRFPGEYPITRGETLDSVIARAGGFTDLAFLDGSVYSREELRVREQKQLDLLAERMRHDLIAFALQANRGAASGVGAAQGGQAAAIGEGLLNQLKSTRAVGRLVLDLKASASADSTPERRLYVKGGDTLYVPRIPQEITVVGEVQNTTSHLYDPALSRDDYVRMSGGATPEADSGRTYVMRANGEVVSKSSSHWFSRSAEPDIRPGDSIVVPLNTERGLSLPLWTSVTTILYNIAITIAAINSF